MVRDTAGALAGLGDDDPEITTTCGSRRSPAGAGPGLSPTITTFGAGPGPTEFEEAGAPAAGVIPRLFHGMFRTGLPPLPGIRSEVVAAGMEGIPFAPAAGERKVTLPAGLT